MKAYRGPDEKVRLFRPDCNIERMRSSAHRAALPVSTMYLPTKLCKKIAYVTAKYSFHIQWTLLFTSFKTVLILLIQPGIQFILQI